MGGSQSTQRQRHRENIRTPHRKALGRPRLWLGNFFLWGNSANHCTHCECQCSGWLLDLSFRSNVDSILAVEEWTGTYSTKIPERCLLAALKKSVHPSICYGGFGGCRGQLLHAIQALFKWELCWNSQKSSHTLPTPIAFCHSCILLSIWWPQNWIAVFCRKHIVFCWLYQTTTSGKDPSEWV